MYELFSANSKNIYKCIRCKIGYTGKMNDGFIESCETIITDCNTASEIFNLLSPYDGKIS